MSWSSGPGEVVLEVRELAKWWDPMSGLRPTSFTMRAGEVLVVRGRSGSGKSTLLSLLAGWCEPDEGSFRLLGRDGGDERWATVAIVPQVLALVPELTVRENVAEALIAAGDECRGLDQRARRERVDLVLEELSLADLADRMPPDTSMGQQQRAAVARAVVARSAVVLADEPTSHQDPGHVEQVVAALAATAAHGSAVLIASHEETVVAAADRVIDLAL